MFSRAEAALAEVLRQVLEDGGDDNYAVAEIVHERSYYAQFLPAGDDALYGEIVSNNHLAPRFALGQEQIRRLLLMGWQRPEDNTFCDQIEGRNFNRIWNSVDSHAARLQVANEVLRAFSEVYDVRSDQRIEIELVLDDCAATSDSETMRELDDIERRTGHGLWPFDIPERAADLFEILPETFTFDALLEAAERLQIASEEATGYLRTYQAEEMVTGEEDRFTKTV